MAGLIAAMECWKRQSAESQKIKIKIRPVLFPRIYMTLGKALYLFTVMRRQAKYRFK